MNQVKNFSVSGMSCAACSARVKKAVEEIAGRGACDVNLLTNSMTVRSTLSDKDIICAVRKAGYDAKAVCDFSDGINQGADSTKKIKIDSETKKLIRRFLLSLIFLLPLMYISIAYAMWNFPVPGFLIELENNGIAINTALGFLEAVLCLCVLIINRKFFISGFNAVKNKAPNMDTLVSLGALFSFVISLAHYFNILFSQIEGTVFDKTLCLKSELHNLYFESAAMIVTFITIGKILESYSKGKTTDAIKSLVKLKPQKSTVLRDGKEITVNADDVKEGETVIVKSGEAIPVDGIIIEGNASINESNLTGESIPCDKGQGGEVFASCLCVSGNIKVNATKVGKETSFSKIISLVQDASNGKASVARAADRVSAVFVPAVLGIAVLSFALWMLEGSPWYFALEIASAVLVISCPCALGLATPVSIMVGNGVAAKNGILFKTAQVLESCGKAKTVVMDKTGTVTEGKPTVTGFYVEQNSLVFSDLKKEDYEKEFLSIVYSAESLSSHPLAKSIADFCKEKNAQKKNVSDFTEVIGSGVSALVDGKKIKIGKVEFILQKENRDKINSTKEKINEELMSGKTVIFVSVDENFLGFISLFDKEKKSSASAVKIFKSLGLKTVLLTGDNALTANSIAERTGIQKVYAGVKPDEKEKIISELESKEHVIMIGDGVNDAPSLKRAFTGIAVGGGTDVALDAADVILLRNDLIDAARAIVLSRKVLKNIYENLFWAFIYNVIGITFASGLILVFFPYAKPLSPMYGAFAMSISSFCVVTNSLRLNLFNLKKIGEKRKMKKTISVKGMMCEHCEKHVKDALEKIAGVKASADHKTGKVSVEMENDVSDDELTKAVTSEGYEVVEIS